MAGKLLFNLLIHIKETKGISSLSCHMYDLFFLWYIDFVNYVRPIKSFVHF